tara:strand:+ start:18 stop:857 length:840 start_codon:yes stop_codon:yes gene_type:complete
MNKETSTIIDTEDLKEKIKTFDTHIGFKLEKLDYRMRLVNYKFEDVVYYFRIHSISVIILATFLTLMEAVLNLFVIENIENKTTRNFIKSSPLVVSSLISLLGTLIKFNKYEEKIQSITRSTEKCISTLAKLKELKEELYLCDNLNILSDIKKRFTKEVHRDYLESNTLIERELLDTDYAKYTKKIFKNDNVKQKIEIKHTKIPKDAPILKNRMATRSRIDLGEIKNENRMAKDSRNVPEDVITIESPSSSPMHLGESSPSSDMIQRVVSFFDPRKYRF